MSTISISSTAGLVLNGAYTNPVDILPGVSITIQAGAAVAASGYAWSITNAGSIQGISGFDLSGGALTNTAGGSIVGTGTSLGEAAIYVRGGTETVTNYGAIRGLIDDERGNGVIINAANADIVGAQGGVLFYRGTGTVLNSGSIQGGTADGVAFSGSTGSITNTSRGFIKGGGFGVIFHNDGGTPGRTIAVNNAGQVLGQFGLRVDFISTVVNSGYILGTADQGVDGGGSYSTIGPRSVLTNDVSGNIKGYLSGVALYSPREMVTNAGTITGQQRDGVALGGGAVLSNAASGTIAAYGAAVQFVGTYTGLAGTIVNYGSITSTNGSLIHLPDGGTVTNAAGGTMTGEYGVFIRGNAGTVVNAGFISGSIHEAIELQTGGLVVNEASGRLQNGFTGVFLSGDGAIVNRGGIVGQTGQGIDTYKGLASITNAAGAYVNGNIGVYLNSGGTLTNAGDITGTGGTAVAFAGLSRNLLEVAPGGHFHGMVVGSPSADNVLELLSGPSTGALTGIGGAVTNFSTIAFDPGAQWDISGDPAGFAAEITGFAPGDVIQITGVTVTGQQYFGGVLTLQEGAVQEQVTISGNFGGEHFSVENVLAGAQVSLACFVLGTRIRTPRGEVDIERLRVGDPVLAHAGDGVFAPRPVVWIGRRSIDCRDARDAWPVRVAAGAFGPGRPGRDLWLSPDHAVFINGVLVPVRYLVNGASIAPVACDEVTYFHIELAMHGVLVAEGLPCESYLDTGNRAAFDPVMAPRRRAAASRRSAAYTRSPAPSGR